MESTTCSGIGYPATATLETGSGASTTIAESAPAPECDRSRSNSGSGCDEKLGSQKAVDPNVDGSIAMRLMPSLLGSTLPDTEITRVMSAGRPGDGISTRPAPWVAATSAPTDTIVLLSVAARIVETTVPAYARMPTARQDAVTSRSATRGAD